MSFVIGLKKSLRKSLPKFTQKQGVKENKLKQNKATQSARHVINIMV
jgi:hypothetical protein